MHNASVAEWIVARFTTRKRAASMVGDLLELQAQKGQLWFWLSLARVVLALAWRRQLAFVAAFMFGAGACSGLQVTESMGFAALASGQLPWMNLFWVFLYILWFVAVYTAIGYGLRDRVAQLALALSVVTIPVVRYGPQRAILTACLGLSLCIVMASLFTRERRRAVLVPLGVAVVGFGAGMPAMYLADQYRKFIVPMPRTVAEIQAGIQAHPSIGWMYLSMILVTVWTMAAACSRIHDLLMRNPSPDSEATETSLSRSQLS